MNAFRRFLLLVAGLVLSITCAILTAINGWGLQPKSWWWIIGLGFVGQIIAQVFITSARED